MVGGRQFYEARCVDTLSLFLIYFSTREIRFIEWKSKNTGFDIARHLTLRVEDKFEMTIQRSTLNSINIRVGRLL